MALVPFPGSQPGAYYPPPDDDEDDDGSGPKMSFLEHLDELRKRIINALLGVLVGVFVAFAFIGKILDFVWGPMRKVLPPDIKLIYTEPAEAFSLNIQVALLAGALLAAPWVMWQVWLFISPGLHSNEKKFALPFVLFTTLGLVCGAAFNHYIAFPFMMRFLASFSNIDLVFMPKISETFALGSLAASPICLSRFSRPAT